MINKIPNVTHTPPKDLPNFKIRVLLHGLLVSSFKKNGKNYDFQVGALNSVVSNHTLSLTIHNLDTPTLEVEKISINESSQIALLGIDNHGVEQFRGKDEGDDYRQWDEEDFRWVLDYVDIHEEEKVVHNTEKIGPILTLHNGVAYSLIRSSDLQFGNDGSDIFRRIALVIAVDISVSQSDHPFLAINGRRVSKYFEPDKSYNIVFRYDCDCDDDTDTSLPLDLNHLNRTFSVPSNLPDFYLLNKKIDDIKNGIRNEINRVNSKKDKNKLIGLEKIFVFTNMSKNEQPDEVIFSTRTDPCGMGFFGTENGLP